MKPLHQPAKTATNLFLQNAITTTKHAKNDSAHNIYGSCNVKNNGPFFLSLVAHYVSSKDRADYARDCAYDIFYTEHVACYEGGNIKVIACSVAL
jgi:hypothetical protein